MPWQQNIIFVTNSNFSEIWIGFPNTCKLSSSCLEVFLKYTMSWLSPPSNEVSVQKCLVNWCEISDYINSTKNWFILKTLIHNILVNGSNDHKNFEAHLLDFNYIVMSKSCKNLSVAEYIPQVYRAQVWQKTQVSQGNNFSNILITGNAPVRLIMKLEWCQAKWLQKAPCPVGYKLESWNERPYFF